MPHKSRALGCRHGFRGQENGLRTMLNCAEPQHFASCLLVHANHLGSDQGDAVHKPSFCARFKNRCSSSSGPRRHLYDLYHRQQCCRLVRLPVDPVQ